MPHGSTRLSIAGAAVRIKTIARAVADSNQALTGVPGGSIDGVGSGGLPLERGHVPQIYLLINLPGV